METPMIKIHNAETGEVIEREMNEKELAQYEKDKADAIAQKNSEAAKATEKAALLTRLGLTADEAKLLLS
jgi:hypothetical protein